MSPGTFITSVLSLVYCNSCCLVMAVVSTEAFSAVIFLSTYIENVYIRFLVVNTLIFPCQSLELLSYNTSAKDIVHDYLSCFDDHDHSETWKISTFYSRQLEVYAFFCWCSVCANRGELGCADGGEACGHSRQGT